MVTLLHSHTYTHHTRGYPHFTFKCLYDSGRNMKLQLNSEHKFRNPLVHPDGVVCKGFTEGRDDDWYVFKKLERS